MIDKFKTESKRYSFLYGKNKEEKNALDKKNKQMQIEKIKNAFQEDNINEKNNNENEKLNEQLYNLDFKSKNLESFKNFSLIKNSIGVEKLDLNFQNIKEKFESKKKNNMNEINSEKNNIPKDDLNKHLDNAYKKENNIYNNNQIIIESDNKNNFNEDILNVTQDQMKIFDDHVNKLYNNHINNIKLKIFQINHPHLHNIKIINNHVEQISSSMTKEQRILPVLQKQKSILKKIQENNVSRSNSSISKINNDPTEHSVPNRENKLIKIFSKRNFNKNKFELFPSYNPRTLDNNILSENYSTSENDKNNSKEKKSLKLQKNINFKPYTLEQYKRKYENNNNMRLILGGLGPNLGGKEWNEKKKMNDIKKIYSDNVKSDNEYNMLNKKSIKLKNKKNDDSKSIISKKDSEFSSYETKNSNRYRIFKTENNIVNNEELKLPLINQRFRSNNKNKLKIIKKNNKDIYNINQEHELEGSEKDLRQLIKQYEQYNENLKL